MITLAKHFAAFAAAVALVAAPVASAKTTIRVQSVIPTKADEVTMLRDYADNVRALTQGEVDIEVLPAGAVVGVKEDARCRRQRPDRRRLRMDALLERQASGRDFVRFAHRRRRFGDG